MVPEKREAELKRLLKEQHKARQDEVFGVSLQRNVLNTKEKQIGFTHWKAKFRQARSLKRVRCLQKQSRNASGTKNPKKTLLKLRRISPTAAEKKVRRNALPIREGSEQNQKRPLKKRAASKSLLLSRNSPLSLSQDH